MNWDLNRQAAAVDEALNGNEPQRVGWFRVFFDDQRWEWSAEVHRMHGYEPGAVELSTDLVLSHKHPDDRAQVAETINTVMNRHEAFSTRHRIVGTDGTTRRVVVVGDLFCDDDGNAVGVHGFYVDVTPASTTEIEDAITTKVAAITERRAAIEQAKGMLKLVYDIDDDGAFNVLKTLSQVHNVKLVPLAQQIAEDFSSANRVDTASRHQFDQLLFSAPRRVIDAAGR